MNMRHLTASVAAIALMVGAVSEANAANLVITTNTASVGQSSGLSTQAATAASSIAGEVRNNVKVDVTSVNLNNVADITMETTGAEATGSLTSFSVNGALSGSEYNVGNEASSAAGQASSGAATQAANSAANATSGASSTDNLLGPDSASNYATSAQQASNAASQTNSSEAWNQAANGAWNQGGQFAAQFGAAYQTTGFSSEYTASNLGLSQISNTTSQVANASSNVGGGMFDYSSVKLTAANLNNQATVNVTVDAGCGC